MRRPLIGALSALLLGGAGLATAGVTPAAAAPDTSNAPKVKAVDFAGTVALSNCSGSVVRMPNSADSDPAFVMSNGHCLESGMPAAGQVIVDKASTRSFTLLNSSGSGVATLRATKIAYATMTDTDVSLYQLSSTYAQIQQSYGIKALQLADSHPVQGTGINVVSGYWKKIYSCNIDGFVYRLKEDEWTWKDSVRYTSACNTIGGTSGSPVVDSASGKVVAINNTGNEDGGRCTLNNPCEVDANGTVTVRKGINYAQETYGITKCVAAGNKINLSLAGCELPKP
ncbi:serine protease [Streptomyces sp. NBS 14/10]|uniref:S1 family peptidase n=1 Tax=Streptomyces sp. NBS 14/10 TaxID=1945643 RepID=UPI000B7EA996|nr:serine protease [Streptomyces sp. NBS 14/10]KAK1181799.1 serine protease [Streptomyces sp. NBS 14/10]NUS85042.1 trypsin-like peptidase domain-containing protein [Streptomyces sp.]